MKKIKYILLWSLLLFVGNALCGQVNFSKESYDTKALNLKVDSAFKKSNELFIKAESTYDKSKETYAQSKETYEVSKKYMEHSMNSLDWLYRYITILLAIFSLAGIVAYRNSVKILRNKIKAAYEKLEKENIQTLNKLIDKHKTEEHLRLEAQLVVFNVKGTEIDPDFEKISREFNSHKTIHVVKLDEATMLAELSKMKLGKFGVVVIEDSDNELEKRLTDEGLVMEDVISSIANKICPDYILFYYGNKILTQKFRKDIYNVKNMFGAANTAAQFYGNLMNLLKFRSIT